MLLLDVRGTPNTVADFWSHVLKRGADECWPWTFTMFSDGYGKFLLKGKVWRAPRLAYALTHPAFNPSLCALHRCDNPACCNPAHLFAGTKGANNSDRKAKRRSNPLRGERHQNSKLKTHDVLAIRSLYLTSHFSQDRLGRMFGVSQTVIGEVVRHETWRHIA